MDISGKNAIVTGASAGIGRATAIMFAQRGAAKVVLADVDQEGLASLSAEINALGAAAITCPVDLSRPDDAIRMYRAAEQASGGLDIFYNNAGIMGGPPDFPDAHLERMIAAINVNLMAMMIGTRLGVEFLRARQARGVIVNCASTAAFGPLPQDPAYAASKRGVLALTESCKPLHDAYDVRVMAICPAITDTAIVAKEAVWLKPILASIKIIHPDTIAAEVCRIVEDDTLSGGFVSILNEAA